MKSKDLYNSISTELQNTYPEIEAKNIALLLLEEFYAINQTTLITNKEIIINMETNTRLSEAISRLKQNEPLQYILGKARFYGRDFNVNRNVLIPRRETEELVHHIIKDHEKTTQKILDIGTGSGCIPITLSLELSGSMIHAIDISNAALATAQENASTLNALLTFYQIDILGNQPLPDTYNIIVSNPPYVLNKEKEFMRSNVLEYEPHLALFVEDNDPLVFYKTIIKRAQKSLQKEGMLYFEINELYGSDIVKEMKNAGFKKVEVIKDMQDKDRIVKGHF